MNLTSTGSPLQQLTLFGFHPETVFFRPGGDNLRGYLCGVPMYASAQPLNFLARTKKSSLPSWKPIVSHPEFRIETI